MKILALELSSARGSVALFNDGNVVFFREWQNDRKNSGPFFEYLAEVLKEFEKPDTIIVGLGPGSYAGTRIAISAAIGLQAASQSRLIGFPSICAIECDTAEYCVIGDARRQTFFLARIHGNNLAESPTLMTEAELRAKLDKVDSTMSIFTSEKLPQFERAAIRYPSAKVLVRLASDANRNFSQPPLEPIYLREPHITIPKK
ncbi:MAG: tRNA (adenosine(37)-N6)-threonylcarbamoyltransferase complex dimerization subunit type 1 TsaB [Verrucomicrobia bacterium 13_1_20CM_4_55_9]|nr:MAG: tRNA (adenosine(37)-N6)-threonylcarbamoyltransferase complex dimerization subunit type 1 TsaB [Verrucomicrobia bacterium 13_1_20CM_4_55_9]PYJ81787.1 MAG: tRNA (adenosine(37)-N6)-threonylcarbamoyltransferase complex dimerization subunit type 1 TsaB [Verrucomicrobiota bacterium]PYL97213.1 MAG: tRNA (adenosine(37)-N6)-threonylcarbamoyltransferase complex dimerization subunit type 1 TsaB [Verrucomicrobiota bacterium]HTD00541.1 tRNA (adenosine(37)-N6)-threonylcarbamoyltransferase complex dime